MKKGLLGIAIGIAMALVWSVCFVNILGPAGIGVGICLGLGFGIAFSLIFSSNNKNDK